MRLAFFLLFALTASAAMAQSGPVGIGFAQAEEGTWLCRDASPEEALACARDQCREQAPGDECLRTAWCFPAGWSGMMTVWSGDFHSTEIVCGAPSEEALKGALAEFCKGEESATHCEPFNVIDPDGNEHAVEGETLPGPTPVTEEAEPAEPEPAAPAPDEPPAGG